jgi:hypothetical protein
LWRASSPWLAHNGTFVAPPHDFGFPSDLRSGALRIRKVWPEGHTGLAQWPLHGDRHGFSGAICAHPDVSIRRTPIYLWNVSQQRSLLQRGTLHTLRPLMPGNPFTLRSTSISTLGCPPTPRVPSRKQPRHLPVFTATHWRLHVSISK